MTTEAMAVEAMQPAGMNLRDATGADFDNPALHHPRTGL